MAAIHTPNNPGNHTIRERLDLNERNPKGHVEITAMKVKPVIDEKTGKILNAQDIVDQRTCYNAIVYVGRSIVRDLMSPNGGTVTDKITQFAMGDGNANSGAPDYIPNPPAPENIDLINQTHIQPFDAVADSGAVSLIFTAVVNAGIANGVWNELALKTANGVLWSRLTYADQNKDPDIFLIFRWVITF